MKGQLEIFIDGASKGNPGEASVGVVFKQDQKTIKEIAKPIGQATNNVAEYTALIYALKEAAVLKLQELKIYTDSGLLYNQLLWNYQVKNENIKTLFDQVAGLARGFKKIELKHIPREKNQEADKLASSVFKKKQAKMVAPAFYHVGEESPSS